MYPYAKTCGMELTVNVERKGEGKVAPVDLGEESWEEGEIEPSGYVFLLSSPMMDISAKECPLLLHDRKEEKVRAKRQPAEPEDRQTDEADNMSTVLPRPIAWG